MLPILQIPRWTKDLSPRMCDVTHDVGLSEHELVLS
jgi:hypothetical protein